MESSLHWIIANSDAFCLLLKGPECAFLTLQCAPAAHSVCSTADNPVSKDCERFQTGTALIDCGIWSKVTLCWLRDSLTRRQPIKTRPEFWANTHQGLVSDPRVFKHELNLVCLLLKVERLCLIHILSISEMSVMIISTTQREPEHFYSQHLWHRVKTLVSTAGKAPVLYPCQLIAPSGDSQPDLSVHTQSSVLGKLKSRVRYAAALPTTLFSPGFPYSSKSASSPPQVQLLSLKFLECVRCCVRKLSWWDQCWQGERKYTPC